MPTKLDTRQSVNRAALSMIGSAANEAVSLILPKIDAEIAKLFEDRNILLTDGGLITFTGTTVQFTEDLLLEINSKVAGGAPVIINLGSATLNIPDNGDMIYAVINRTAGTAVVTDNASTLPAVTSANQEVFLIAKRADSGDGIQRLYFRNGTALDAGQTVRLGASGSGAGNANAYLESLKNTLIDSEYALVTPDIISVDEDDLLDGASTAAYSLIDKTINFTAIGQTLITTQLADPDEFMNNTNALSSVDLQVFWRLSDLDALATYEVSRNGGNEWQVVDMERVGNTDLFHGSHVFTQEASNQSLSSLAVVTSSFELNATTQQSIAQGFTLASKHLLKTVTLELNKAGSPAGNFYVQIIADNAGSPSTAADAVLAESDAIPLSSVSAGNSSLVVNIPDTYLIAGTYHVGIRTDAAYKASFVTATTRLAWRGNAAASAPFIRIYNGTAWSTSSGNQIAYSINGLTVDLRVRVTAGTANVKLEALGIFYEKEPGSEGITTGLKNREVFNFSGNSNTFQFVVTKFVPDPDLLKVYDVATGQVYTYGAFSIDGQTVSFTTGQFAVPGQNITLVFDQLAGGSFDNSDLNALLLAANHLGSQDGTIDKSIAGLGLFLRRPDGTLREIAIDNNDNIVVYSV